MTQAMKRILTYILLYSILPVFGFAQIVNQGEEFESVPLIENKITFLKAVPIKKDIALEENYKILKNWAVENYGKDPFISSVRYDAKNNEFIAKSRIELLLPANAKGVREKMIMRYRINGFIFQEKCILEITDISYLYENSSKNKLLPRVIRGEEFITDAAIAVDDLLKEFRQNTRKSTLFFLNEIGKNFESKFGY